MVPCPTRTRLPRKPYTISASFGPALTNSFAMPANSRKSATQPSPTHTCNSCDITFLPGFPKKSELLLAYFSGVSFRLTGNLIPCAHVGDASLVARYYHFGAPGNRRSVFAARSTASPRPNLLKNHLAGSSSANGTGHSTQDAGHLIFGRIDTNVVLHQKLRQKKEDDQRAYA